MTIKQLSRKIQAKIDKIKALQYQVAEISAQARKQYGVAAWWEIRGKVPVFISDGHLVTKPGRHKESVLVYLTDKANREGHEFMSLHNGRPIIAKPGDTPGEVATRHYVQGYLDDDQ